MMKAFNLIPPELRSVTYIAGGAAYAPDTARDVDLWIVTGDLPLRGVEAEDLRPRCFQHIADGNFANLSSYPGGEKYRELLESGQSQGELREGVNYVGCYEVDGLEIDVLIADYPSIQALLDSFDLDIHARAIGFDGRRIGPEGKPGLIRVQNWRSPERTLERVRRFLERYRIPVLPEHWDRLMLEVDMIAAGKEVAAELCSNC